MNKSIGFPSIKFSHFLKLKKRKVLIFMRKLHIVCPICSKFKRIPIPVEIFNIDQGNLLKLPLGKGTICEHQFIAVIDYHFAVRDYEIPKNDADFKKILHNDAMNQNTAEFSFF
jgi:hypothetical protein